MRSRWLRSEWHPGAVEEARQESGTIGGVQGVFLPVGDTRIGHFRGGDGVRRGDVDRPDYPFEAHELAALVDVDVFLPAHQEIAVLQPLHDRDGNVADEAVALLA